jgi:hypothetical protein
VRRARDAAREAVHVLGKPANANEAWLHVMYDVARDRWTPSRNIGVEPPGHVYGNLALGPSTGDLYLGVYSKRIQRYDQASGHWMQPAVDISADSIQGHFNGVAWHPDLHGPGDGGVTVTGRERHVLARPIPSGGLSELYHLPFGVMVQHPADPAQILLLERQGDFRVWSTQDGVAWRQQDYVHPYQDQATYVVVSQPAFQVI